jgi:16S rRNA G966 N2-methylase RsmD
MTGKLFGQSRSNTDNALKLADALRSGDTEIASAENASTALAILTARRLREVEKLQEARRLATQANEAARKAAQELRAAINAQSDDDSWAAPSADNVPISVACGNRAAMTELPMNVEARRHAAYDEACRRFTHVECSLKYLASMPASSLDGIYCDPPYGIEDEHLDIRNIETTRAEHDRDANIALFEPTLRAAYRVLKPESYAVFWCDPEHFTTHLRHAEALGFRVLRWPLIAKKPIAKNGAAAFNPTKDYETLFVVAKTNAVLATRRPTSFVPWTWRERESERYVHPFKKPFSAHEYILRTFWSPGARIHDPFCGEGSAVLAGHELGYDMSGSDSVEDHLRRARLHFETLFA